MLTLLYPISYLLSLTGLILWFYFRDHAWTSRKMSTLFLFSFLVYLVSLAFSDASLSYRLLILFRDLVILGVVSQVFNYVRKSALVVLVIAIGIYGLIQFAGFTMLMNTFPEITIDEKTLDDGFELLVETKDGQVPDSYRKLIEKYHLTAEPAFHPADPSLSQLDEFVMIGIPDASEQYLKKIIKALRRMTGTLYIEYNEIISLEPVEENAILPSVTARHVNDPLASQQWGWDAVQGDRVQEVLGNGGIRPKKKALIAILDTGIDAQHEDLRGQFRSSGASYDTDPVGHGTHCAGIAAAVSNNGLGIASLVPSAEFAQVTSIKVLNASGIGSQQSTIKGILEAADAGADVISLSLGSVSNDARQKAYSEAVKYANAKGAIVIAAAGNSNMNSKNYSPANAKGIIAVAALDVNQAKAPFSNFVQDIAYPIAAPGVKIMSTYPGQQYKELNGTSMATPMVAGLIGLMKAIRPELTTEEVYRILKETGKSIPDEKITGRLVQGAAAIERVSD